MVAGPLRDRLPRPAPFEQVRHLVNSRQRLHRRDSQDDNVSAANFFIPNLPGQPASSQLVQYAGHLPSAPIKNGRVDTDSDAHLFFYLVRNRHIADKERTLLWFNGGPGCSSFDGALMEVGPLRLVPSGNGQLQEATAPWNEYANVIFIDQPVGTGYSYVSTNEYVHELPEAAAHVVKFLENFYKVFPEFQNHQTYLGGESYAGQYIPYIAQAILASHLPTSSTLQGLLIGNGWIDPYNQYPAYLDFALDAGVIKKGTEAESVVKKQVERCMTSQDKLGRKNVRIHSGVCEGILGAITDSTIQSVNGQNMCVNNYDVRLTDTHPACGMNWPPDLTDITPYLSREDVKSAFHATRHAGPWTECNGRVGSAFYTPISAPSVTLLPELLERVEVLMFAGAEDLICNHVGIERMIDDLEWNGEVGFGNSTKPQDWYVNGKNAGTWQSARNLTYVKILEASHMVPYDQPLAAHDMFLRFVGVSSEFLNAAGPAAQIPSRIGSEQEAVLGSTHPNGTSLNDLLSSSSGGGGAGVDGSDSSVLGSIDGSMTEFDGAGFEKGLGSSGGSASSSSSYLDRLTGSTLEGLANASSAIVLVLIMVAAFGVFVVCRRRFARRNGKLRAGARGQGWGVLGGGGARAGSSRGKHARVESLGRGGGAGLGLGGSGGAGGGGRGGGGATDSEEQELDELMRSRRGDVELGYGDDDDADDDDAGRIDSGRGKGKGLRGARGRRSGVEEEIFDLGAEEEDEEELEDEERKGLAKR
ncbi:hypothetical protein JCM10212_004824 [Sporobolomyces blumeae]